MKLLAVTTIAALAVTAIPTGATADPSLRWDRLDRVEDRIDRRENRIDRATDNGRLDRIEDRVDFREDRRDRRGVEGPSQVDRAERRSWRRTWGHSDS